MKFEITIASIAIALASVTPTAANAADAYQVAEELGSVLASEEFCGLKYNQVAVKAFIESKVKADDMGFAESLRMKTDLAKFALEKMTPSQKTAHCTQIHRVALSYKFIAN